MVPTVPSPLLNVSVISIPTYLLDLLIGISLISYWQLLFMLENGKQTCHSEVSTNHSLRKVWGTKFGVAHVPSIWNNFIPKSQSTCTLNQSEDVVWTKCVVLYLATCQGTIQGNDVIAISLCDLPEGGSTTCPEIIHVIPCTPSQHPNHHANYWSSDLVTNTL